MKKILINSAMVLAIIISAFGAADAGRHNNKNNNHFGNRQMRGGRMHHGMPRHVSIGQYHRPQQVYITRNGRNNRMNDNYGYHHAHGYGHYNGYNYNNNGIAAALFGGMALGGVIYALAN